MIEEKKKDRQLAEKQAAGLMRVFSQRIGVYYRTKEWRDWAFDLIRDVLPPGMIVRTMKSMNNAFIHLKDGTTIDFVSATESSRGKCFSKILMQPGIDEDFYRCVICPTHKDMYGKRDFELDYDGVSIR